MRHCRCSDSTSVAVSRPSATCVIVTVTHVVTFSLASGLISCAPSLLLPVLSSAPVLSSRAHPILSLPIYPPVPGLFRPLAPIPRARWSVLLHPVSLSLELLPILSYPSAPVHSSRAHPASRAFLSFCAHPILSRLVCPPMPGLFSCNLVLGLFSHESSVLFPVRSHPSHPLAPRSPYDHILYCL